MKQLLLTFTLISLCASALLAQVGSFNKDLSFNGENRQVSFFVPNNYDSSQQYGLVVCLHGLGDNSSTYRNAIINSLKWNTIFTHSIFVFPDGGNDVNSDFYSPTGDELFLETAINYCKNQFNINPNDIVLQGFSLGGRSAFKYGLDHPTVFKALLLNTPAFQGLLDLQNNPAASLMYNFSNASKLPIFISLGTADEAYFGPNEQLVYQLKLLNAPVYFQQIKGMGHSIAVNAQIKKCVNFFDQKAVFNKDLELFRVESPLQVCSNSFTANCYIRNNGVTTIQGFSIQLKIGEQLIKKSLNVSIQSNEFIKVPIEVLALDNHQNSFFVTIDFLDDDSTNNQMSKPISLKAISQEGIIKDGFENLTNWSIQKSGSLFEWYLDDVAKKSGSYSLGSFNTILYFNTLNSVETVVSKAIDLSKIDKKTLSFDVAFNYTKYTPPYFSAETVFADTLELQISTDCGNTFQTIYKKGGRELATSAEPILNPLNISQLNFNPTADEWRREIIDLKAFAASSNAIFKINCISGMGGILNIDNLSFGENAMSVQQFKKQEKVVSIYPNPASDLLFFETQSPLKLEFYDMEGSLVKSVDQDLESNSISIADLPNGIYSLRFIYQDTIQSKSLVVQH
ncbi:MAG: T9SS type A sorting domain-containing protein [Bacteroidia bacterium]